MQEPRSARSLKFRNPMDIAFGWHVLCGMSLWSAVLLQSLDTFSLSCLAFILNYIFSRCRKHMHLRIDEGTWHSLIKVVLLCTNVWGRGESEQCHGPALGLCSKPNIWLEPASRSRPPIVLERIPILPLLVHLLCIFLETVNPHRCVVVLNSIHYTQWLLWCSSFKRLSLAMREEHWKI